MGQAGSKGRPKEAAPDDVKRQVDGGGQQQRRLYQLVDVKTGGGQLLDLMRRSSRLRSSSSASSTSSTSGGQQPDTSARLSDHMDAAVDRQIYELVQPLLYNGGRGKLVPLSQLWALRYSAANFGQADDAPEPPAPGTGSRLVCWRLDERGFVGETALHICFLLSTQWHMALAQKLLKFFPLLVNDIYTCDQYFGESSLHMAIVNENVRIVKLLVDHGADVHERCLGSFFLPDDQKDRCNQPIKRMLLAASAASAADEPKPPPPTTGSAPDLRANHFASLASNYQGYVYWGEYPLSFAACLGLADCYQLLLAKDADPDRPDSNGNTSLHMTVIADRQDMFDLCYSNGANLGAINWQQLSPLALAARLKRPQMFFHILHIQRRVSWIFCQVAFVEVPLEGVDSVDAAGHCDEHSVLSIVVFGNSTEHLEMLDGFLEQLLRAKWATSVRRKFLWLLAQFLVILAVSFVAYATRLLLRQQQPSSSNLLKVNLCAELFLVLYSLAYLVVASVRLLADFRPRSLLQLMRRAPEVALFMLTCALVVLCLPLRLAGLQQLENLLASLIMFALPLKLLFFCRASQSLGPFVLMIYKILRDDVLCFVVFLVIFVAGFSSSFFIIFKTHTPTDAAQNTTTAAAAAADNNYFGNLFDGLLAMHMMALNEFGVVYDQMDATRYPTLAKTLFLFYMVLVSILLMNMLIAMLGKTYQDISSQPNENLRQWARALLTVERLWSARERLAMAHKYSHTKPDSQARFYRSTWTLQPDDLNKINALRRLNAQNRKNSARLRAVRCKKEQQAQQRPPN